MERYTQALLRQWNEELTTLEIPLKSLPTLYIGGGTPSTLPLPLMEKIFDAILPYLAMDAEITVEANPGSATRAWLEGIKNLGATRLSLGVQSFHPHKLAWLGRRHSDKEAEECVYMAQQAGFKHLSIDLIYATPLDTPELLEAEAERAASLPIDHLSAYALTIEEGTPFAKEGRCTHEHEEELSVLMLSLLKQAGFIPYEISNFSRGYISRHNSGYWEGRDYIGLGAGAVGLRNGVRYYPKKNIDEYIADPLTHTLEPLSPHDRHIEEIFLGLRSYIGLKSAHLTPIERERAELLANEGKLQCHPDGYYNPNFLLADELALYLIA